MKNLKDKLLLKIISGLVFISFCLGQIVRLPIPFIGSSAVSLLDVAIIFSNLFIYWHFLKDRHKKLHSYYLLYFVPLLFTLGLSFLGHAILHPVPESLVAFAYYFRFINYFFFAVLFPWYWDKCGGIYGLKISDYLLLAIGSMAFLGLLQYLFLPDMKALYFIGWDRHYFRLIGPLLDPNFSGLVFTIGIVILTARYKKELLSFRRENAYQALFILLFVCLVLTFSRGSWIAFFILFFIQMLWHKRARIFFLLLLLFAFLYFLLPKPHGEGVNIFRTSTIRARLNNYKEAIFLIKEHPFLGVGYNFLRYAKIDNNLLLEKAYESHSGAGFDSSALFSWATGGIVALLAYLFFFWRTLQFVIKKNDKMIILLILGVFFHSFFYNSFYFVPAMFLYLLLLGSREYSGQ